MGCKKQEVQEVLTLHVHGFISGTPIGNKPIVEWKGKALILNKLKFHDKKIKNKKIKLLCWTMRAKNQVAGPKTR